MPSHVQEEFFNDIDFPVEGREEIDGVLRDMAYRVRRGQRPDALREFRAIQALMDSGATIPQISLTFGIPEAFIFTRLRIGHLLSGLLELFAADRMSISLATRLGAESLQTQQRIWNNWTMTSPQPMRMTSAFAYPETTPTEQILLPVIDWTMIEAFILDQGVSAFLEHLSDGTRNAFMTTLIPQAQAEVAAANTSATALSEEVDRQRDRYRALETRAGRPSIMEHLAPAQPPTEAEGRAYREMLPGPSDDPTETGATPLMPAAMIAAAQYDYPVAEESWELVVDHLTEAADAMPLSPSDESDRFHIDIESLRTRAIAQRVAEDANVGVTVGRVEPPVPAPEPAEANRGQVRRATRPPHETTSLTQHAALLREQADAINANTRRARPGMSTTQQAILESSRRAGQTAAREAIERGAIVIHPAVSDDDVVSLDARVRADVARTTGEINRHLEETVRATAEGLQRAEGQRRRPPRRRGGI